MSDERLSGEGGRSGEEPPASRVRNRDRLNCPILGLRGLSTGPKVG